MRILYIAGNPDGMATLQIEKELNLLREEVDNPAAEPVDFRIYSHVNIRRLTSICDRVEPDIIHFSAHGADNAIVLAVPERGKVAIDGAMLTRALATLRKKPKLIVINACNSAGMASDLVGCADFVVGNDAPIANVDAREFAAQFYLNLAGGAALWDALTSAAAAIGLGGSGAVTQLLFPISEHQRAKRYYVTNAFRILARFPHVERALNDGRTQAPKSLDRENPKVQFGLAGAPAATRQVMLCTDDETVQPHNNKQSLADARAWFLETQSVNRQVWIDDAECYYGDLYWYAAIMTSDRQIVSCKSGLVEALERYYFVEQRRGELPARIERAVRETLRNLLAEGGDQ